MFLNFIFFLSRTAQRNRRRRHNKMWQNIEHL